MNLLQIAWWALRNKPRTFLTILRILALPGSRRRYDLARTQK
jgi:hypothetical protein